MVSIPYSEQLCSNHLEIESCSDSSEIKTFSYSAICQPWGSYCIQLESSRNVVLSRINVLLYIVIAQVNCSFKMKYISLQ